MGLNYDFRDLSENLRKINHFEKLNKANIKKFSCRKCYVFRILYGTPFIKEIIVRSKAKKLSFSQVISFFV